MFPYSEFPRAVGSFQQPVERPTGGPDEGEQVCVQFGRNWLPYVLGSLQQLLLQQTWVYATKADLQDIQHDVFDLIALFGNQIDSGECPTPMVEPQFRQPDDCTLQVSIDGGATWSDIYSGLPCATGAADNAIADALLGGTVAPGTYQPIPVAPPTTDNCQEYDVTLKANQSWVLPTTVGDGWEIDISNSSGAAYDGSGGPLWECPTGQIYTLGVCGANVGTSAGDPLNTVNHMRLIMRVGTVYTDAANTSYVVPVGTGTVSVVFQVNDSQLADNQGQYTFHVKVCNHVGFAGCNVNANVVNTPHGMIINPNGIPSVIPGGFSGYYTTGVGFQPRWHNYAPGTDSTLAVVLSGPITPGITPIGMTIKYTHNKNVSLPLFKVYWQKSDGTYDSGHDFSLSCSSTNGNNIGSVTTCTAGGPGLSGIKGFNLTFNVSTSDSTYDKCVTLTDVQVNC